LKKGLLVLSEKLVSILVITYNSSKYVLETLESCKNQTFKNIELVISDDGSTDDTIEKCKKWINENENNFIRYEIVESPINTGIPANCNRGVKAAKGEWIKLIAGDDVLLDNCINDNIHYVSSNSNVRILISEIEIFKSIDGVQKIVGTRSLSTNRIFTSSAGFEMQYKYLLYNHFGNAPSLFIHKSIFRDVMFDERFLYLEDYPFVLNVTKMNYKFYYLSHRTVRYRLHEKSVSNSSKANKMIAYSKDFNKFEDLYLYNEIKFVDRFFRKVERVRKKFLYNSQLMNYPLLFGIINRLSHVISPYQYIKNIKLFLLLRQI
jgi:glycosyltransferase involved in cell wall biosynthesis